MELEAGNLWMHSASHEFEDKNISSKNINFLVENIFREKNPNVFRQTFSGKFLTFLHFHFSIDFSKLFFRGFFGLENFFFETKKSSKKNLRKVN